MDTLEKLYRHYLQHPRISTDSRKIEKDCIFFALKGESFNGNDYAREAVMKGASLAVIDEGTAPDDKNYLIVHDVLESLQQLAACHRRQSKAIFIGITGSNGKTTTKELITRVLSSSYRAQATEGNLNNHIGVPLTILSLDRDTEYAVIEMGANHKGEIADLCTIADPGFGIITNIGRAHLEGFGGFNGVIQAKSELYQHIRSKKGTTFVNADDELLAGLSVGLKKFTYGTSSQADCRGKLLSSDPFLKLEYSSGNKHLEIESALYGTYNFPNVMAAIAIGEYFKVPSNSIAAAIKSYIPENNRSQIFRTDKDNTLILDAYNANPSSMEAAVENFRLLKAGKKMLILGDMRELGEESHNEHKKVVELLKGADFNRVILVGQVFSSMDVPANWLCYPDVSELCNWLESQDISGHTILIKGSRLIRLEETIRYL